MQSIFFICFSLILNNVLNHLLNVCALECIQLFISTNVKINVMQPPAVISHHMMLSTFGVTVKDIFVVAISQIFGFRMQN